MLKSRSDKQGVWDKCHLDPTLALFPSEIEALGDVNGKKICVLGSGNNCVVFALAGMGADVTSVDISEAQLRIAEERAEILGLTISFVRADVTDLDVLPDESFDAVYTGGHVAIWVSNLERYYSEAVRILKTGRVLIVNEYHPFRTIWSSASEHLIIERPYGERGPFEDKSNGLQYEFNWTVSDYVNSVLKAGCALELFDEFGGQNNEEDWMKADLRGLPADILIVGRKR